MDIIADVAKLKAEVATATALRAQADAQLGVSRQELERIDTKLRDLGVDPDQAEQELKLLEASVQQTVTELSTLVGAEITAYRTILAATAGAR